MYYFKQALLAKKKKKSWAITYQGGLIFLVIEWPVINCNSFVSHSWLTFLFCATSGFYLAAPRQTTDNSKTTASVHKS